MLFKSISEIMSMCLLYTSSKQITKDLEMPHGKIANTQSSIMPS